ncbi:MAG: hypothetical protein ACOVP1_08245 [Bacteroidia bacterium]
MEHLENNIIKQKLESLDTLPEYYEVNLHSKFDLVMQANQKPKKNIMIWLSLPISIAASILLIFFLFDLNANKSLSASKIQFEKTKIQSLPLSTKQIVLGYPTRPKLKGNLNVKVQSTKPATPNLQQNKPLISEAQLNLRTDSMVSNIPELAQATSIKKKKNRFQDLDFNEQIIPGNLASESKKEIHFVKFKLPDGVLVNSVQSEKILSYRQSF